MGKNLKNVLGNLLKTGMLQIDQFAEWLSLQSPNKMFRGKKKNACPLHNYISTLIPSDPEIILLVYTSYFCVQYKSNDIYYYEVKLPTWAKCFSKIVSVYSDISVSKCVKLIKALKQKQETLVRHVDSNGFVNGTIFGDDDIMDTVRTPQKTVRKEEYVTTDF